MRLVYLLVVSFFASISQALRITGINEDARPAGTRCMKALRDPDHGRIYSSDTKGYYEYEDVVAYVCDRGYDLIGNYRLECLENGEWDHPEPTCQIKSCGMPDELLAVKHGSIVDYETKQFTYLERVVVKCDDWYELVGGTSVWRCEDNKQWVRDDNIPNRNLPVCRPRCGHRLVKDDLLTGLVSGGKQVKLHGGWPWMALVVLEGGKARNNYCGGTLVDEQTVVTAATCLYSLDVDETVEVWLGLLNRKTDNFNFTQKFVVPALKIFQHPRYDVTAASPFDFDIGVLKLESPAKLSFWVHPICIPTSPTAMGLPDTYRNERMNAIVTGWGKTERGTTSLDLMKTRVPLVDRRACASSYMKKFGKNLITENMLCAGFPDGRNDACQGDGGGPLMTRIASLLPRWYLSGVVSFGDETLANSCGQPGAYGVYTDVGKVVDFLQAMMEFGH